MKWYLLIMFAGSAHVVPVDSKAACDELRQQVTIAYGKGSALIDARCVAVVDGGAPTRK